MLEKERKEVFVCFPVGTEMELNDELIKRAFKSLFMWRLTAMFLWEFFPLRVNCRIFLL